MKHTYKKENSVGDEGSVTRDKKSFRHSPFTIRTPMQVKSVFWFLLFIQLNVFSQSRQTENVIIITMDGFRWQELFTGADKELIHDSAFTSREEAQQITKRYWSDEPVTRRKALMPFFWNYIAVHGQVYGNRQYDNKVNVKNPYWFSYPGYNEIFTGYPDSNMNTNKKIQNPNVNVLEFIHSQKKYSGKVAAFSCWDVMDYILNEERSGYLVNSGYEVLTGNDLSEAQQMLNLYQHTLPLYYEGVRYDASTCFMAKEYLKINHPRVLYISLGETDEFAHEGKYMGYLNAAHATDTMFADLWHALQQDTFYKGKTTLFITVDHGRGLGKQWTSHNNKYPHSDEIWFAVIGPDTPPAGEIKKSMQLYQNQFAKTIAALLGLDFNPKHPTGAIIHSVTSK